MKNKTETKYLYYDKFLTIKEKIIETFKKHDDKLNQQQHKLNRLTVQIKILAIIDIVIILFLIWYIINY